MTTNIIVIRKVAEPYGWLGNMSAFPIELDGKWRTAEALFQAGRFSADDPIRKEIQAATSPMTAKSIAKSAIERMVLVPQSKLDLLWMQRVLEMKLAQHPKLEDALVETGDAWIVEDVTNRPHQTFWGARRLPDGNWEGQNHLGRLWMEIRQRSVKSRCNEGR